VWETRFRDAYNGDVRMVTEGEKLVVYDMPIDLIKQYISMAKLFFDNKMHLAMAEGMKLLLEKYGDNEGMSRRLDNIEIALNALLLERKEEKPKELKTFGGGRNEKTQTR